MLISSPNRFQSSCPRIIDLVKCLSFYCCQLPEENARSRKHSQKCLRYNMQSLREYMRNSSLDQSFHGMHRNHGFSTCDQPVYDLEGINIQRHVILAPIGPSRFRITVISLVLSSHFSWILACVNHEGIHSCKGFHVVQEGYLPVYCMQIGEPCPPWSGLKWW